MDGLLNAAIDHVWPQIANLRGLTTPDAAVGRPFFIRSVTSTEVQITTEAGSPLTIQRAAFLAAIRYLVVNGHDSTNPCDIRSNQHAENSGPLCTATRRVNSNTRVINYIVPILTAVGILGFIGTRPNKTWLV